MKQIVLVSGILIASLVLAGCKKKDAATTEGSAAPAGSAGSAAAMGSGSATAEPAGSAAAGSAAAGSAAAAAPTSTDPAGPAKVTAKRGGKDEGSFEKALYAFREKSANVYIAQACDKFNCSHIDAKGSTIDEALQKDCPSAKVMKIGFNFDAEPKAGAVQVSVEVNGFSSGGTITSNWTDGGKVDEVSDKVFKGSIDVKDGKDYAAKGEFTATVCK